jgi:hypothetical protein
MKQVKKPLRTLAIVAAGGVLGVGLLAGATSAQAQPPAPTASPASGLISHTVSTLSSADSYIASVRKYWTPARMRGARAADTALDRAQVAKLAADAAKNAQASPRSATPKAAPNTAAKSSGSIAYGHNPTVKLGGAMKSSVASVYKANETARKKAHRTLKESPTVGKVFFTRDGLNYVCSGSVIPSKWHNFVLTAGHCTNMAKKWDSKFTFVPYYHNGTAPYGSYPAKKMWTTSQWYNHNNDLNYAFQYDISMVATYTYGGHYPGSYTGWNAIAFSKGTKYKVAAMGYPAESPYGGEYQRYWRATTKKFHYGLYMKSGLTGGSSGGPWLVSYSNSKRRGVAYGVNSVGPANGRGWMASPYFGYYAKKLWTQVHNFH